MNKQSTKRRRRLAAMVTAILAAVGIVIGVVGTGSGTAEAGGCVSRSEYRTLTKGITPRQVYNRTGTWGTITSDFDGHYYDAQDREYRACNSRGYGFVDITFDNDHNVGRNHYGLASKYAYWG